MTNSEETISNIDDKYFAMQSNRETSTIDDFKEYLELMKKSIGKCCKREQICH